MQDATQPITRQDLTEALGRAAEAITTAVRAAIKASEENTYARIERVETTLLTEFHKWASPAEMRARSHAAVLRAIDAGIEFLPTA
jgi:hypothetical protein